MMLSKNTVVIVAAFPPPMGGAAKNTKIISDEIEIRGADVKRFSTSANGLAHTRSFIYHLRRLATNLNVVFNLLKLRNKARTTFYTVPDGGLGSWYTLLHIIASKLISERQAIHHRTFKYIDNFSIPVKIFTYFTNRTALHVFLSRKMAEKYLEQYGHCKHIVAGNAVFVSAGVSHEAVEKEERGCIVIGHLSNLCRDKGFFETVEAFEHTLLSSVDCKLVLAGPVLEAEVQNRLEELKSRHGDRISHIGPVTGDAKSDFYKGIDLFLFPTQFDLEAQPNVLYEAFSCGVPVITTDRGCISEMINKDLGFVIKKDANFTRSASDIIKKLYDGEIIFDRDNILSHLSNEIVNAKKSYETIFSYILGDDICCHSYIDRKVHNFRQ